MEKLLEAQEKLVFEGFQTGIGLPYAPVVNGTVLADTINGIIEKGQMNQVPTIIGSTKNDITVTADELAMGDSKINRSNIDYSLMNERLQNNPSYVYRFIRDLPGDDAGAFHSSELWYTFGTLEHCWRPMTDGDKELSQAIIGYWSNFMRTGNPNGDGLPDWKPCTGDSPYIKEFDVK